MLWYPRALLMISLANLGRNIFRYLQGAALNLVGIVLGGLLGIVGHIAAHGSVANAIMSQVEFGRIVGEAAIMEALDGVIYGGIHAF